MKVKMNTDVKIKVCDICCQPAADNSNDIACEQIVIPGSDGSKAFNEHLRLYFILTKLLHCSEKESLSLLTKLAESKIESENKSIVLRACFNCDDTVRKAFELYQNVVAVKRKIDKLGEGLTNLIKLSEKEVNENSESSLRQALKKQCFEIGDSNTPNIKLEVDAEFIENFENEATGFDDSYFDQDEGDQHNGVKAESGRSDQTSFMHNEEESESTSHERMPYKSAGKFTCDFCDSVFTSELGFRKHGRMHEESKLLGNIHDCSLCRHPNLSESNLRRHMTRTHGCRNKGPSQRRNSEVLGSKMKITIKPDTNESNDSDSDFDPTSTRKVFRKNRARNRILKLAERTIAQKTRRLQTGATQNYFRCEFCECVYESHSALQRHLVSHEKSKLLMNKFDCPQCKYPALSEGKLRRHIVKKHESSKNTCHICGHFSSKRHLHERHMLHEHSITVCEPISSENTQSTSTSVHDDETTMLSEFTSTTENPSGKTYTCELCDCEIVYTTTLGLRKHMSAHKRSKLIGNKYDCHYCRYPTITERSLRYHITHMHESNSSTPPKQTQRVQVSDSSPVDLNADLSEHSTRDTEKPSKKKIYTLSTNGHYKCKLCKSIYTTFPGIRKHELMHTASDQLGNIYNCRICQHPNLSAPKLKRHMTAVHGRRHDMGTSYMHATDAPEKNNDNEESIDKLNQVKLEPMSSTSVDLETDVTEHFSEDTEDSSMKKIYELSADGLYKCKLCESTYTSFPGIRKHERMHTESDKLGNIYNCRICQHPNLSAPKLNRHMTAVHNRSQQIIGTCTRKVIREKIARNRILKLAKRTIAQKTRRLQTGATQKYFRCEFCECVYESLSARRRHLVSHEKSNLLMNKFDCPQCKYPALSEEKLRQHIVKRHESMKNTCHICGHFSSKRHLHERHMLNEHNITVREPISSENTEHKSTSVHDKTTMVSEMSPTTVINREHRVRNKESRFCELEKKSATTIKCKFCKASYWYQRLYNKHMIDHEQSKLIDDLWECKICRFPCLTEESLQTHRRKHENRNQITVCKICNKTIRGVGRAKTHMQVHAEYDQWKDPATGLYRCKLCPYVGRTIQGIICHRTSVHRDEVLNQSVEHLLCPQCGIRFFNLFSLKRHIKNVHENNYNYTCEKCGKGFDATQAFNNHKTTHDENRVNQHICDICGVAYSRKWTLQFHMKKYHSAEFANIPASDRDGRRFPKDKEYKCRWCKTAFPFKYMLNNHMPTVHQDLYTFSCDQCDKKYLTSSSLKLHKEITHSNESKTSQCEYCDKQFSHRHNVICHYKFCDSKRKHDKGSTELQREET